MQRTLRRFGWLDTAAMLGCGDGRGAEQGVAVRDSAGVTIVVDSIGRFFGNQYRIEKDRP